MAAGGHSEIGVGVGETKPVGLDVAFEVGVADGLIVNAEGVGVEGDNVCTPGDVVGIVVVGVGVGWTTAVRLVIQLRVGWLTSLAEYVPKNTSV